MSTQEEDELNLALAMSLSESDRKPCNQSDAFLTSKQVPTRKRDEQHWSDGRADGKTSSTDGRRAPQQRQNGNNGSIYGGEHRNNSDRNHWNTAQPPSTSYNNNNNNSQPNNRQGHVATTNTPTRPAVITGGSSFFNRPLQPLQQLRQLYKELSPALTPSAVSCSGCRRGIMGAYLVITDDYYHPECFRCAGCSEQLVGSHYPKGDPPLHYHKQCAEELFSPRCCLCEGVLRGQYLKHPYFPEEIYCIGHDDCQQCFACNRREPVASKGSDRGSKGSKEGFTRLHDGRASCMDCISTAVIDSQEALPLYLEAVHFMQDVLRLPIPPGMREVPILAVDLPSLNEQQQNTRNGSHTGSGSVTRGLTLSSIGQVRHITGGSVQFSSSGYITVTPQVHRIEEVREVTAVCVLFGLPRDLTAAILAHEAMHVWMRLTKSIPYPLPLQLEEGLCQVVSRGYLDGINESCPPSSSSSGASSGGPSGGRGNSHTVFSSALNRLEYCPVITPSSSLSSSSQSDKKRALRAYFKNQIETDCTSVYGDGFREAQRCVTALGMEIVLEVVRETKQLPCL